MATSIPLFKGAIADWNDLQVEFVSWCHFYYNLQNIDDLPENIIEDDVKLDHFLYQRRLKIKTDKLKAEAERNLGNKKPRSKNSNLFTFDPYDDNAE